MQADHLARESWKWADLRAHLLTEHHVDVEDIDLWSDDVHKRRAHADLLHREAHNESDRVREGLRRLKNQDYDSGYTAETYAEAILAGTEPTGEATIDG